MEIKKNLTDADILAYWGRTFDSFWAANPTATDADDDSVQRTADHFGIPARRVEDALVLDSMNFGESL